MCFFGRIIGPHCTAGDLTYRNQLHWLLAKDLVVTQNLHPTSIDRIATDVDAFVPAAASTTAPPLMSTTDGELLMQFTRHGDQAAFARLVDAHAALVWSACRQVLHRQEDVDTSPRSNAC